MPGLPHCTQDWVLEIWNQALDQLYTIKSTVLIKLLSVEGLSSHQFVKSFTLVFD
jgi:hypothetical protein